MSLVILGVLLVGCGSSDTTNTGSDVVLKPLSVVSSSSFFTKESRTKTVSGPVVDVDSGPIPEISEVELTIIQAVIETLESDLNLTLISVEDAEYPNISVSEGEFLYPIEAFIFVEELTEKLKSTCGVDKEGFVQLIHCGEVQIIRSGAKVSIIISKDIYFSGIRSNYSVVYNKWESGMQTTFKLYLPLKPKMANGGIVVGKK